MKLSITPIMKLHTPFGIEWNLGLMSRSSYKHHISIPETGEWNQPLSETREHAPVQEIRLADEHEGVAVRFLSMAPPASGVSRLKAFPIRREVSKRYFNPLLCCSSGSCILVRSNPGSGELRRALLKPEVAFESSHRLPVRLLLDVYRRMFVCAGTPAG